MRYQAILFDIDGTLIDSLPPYVKVMSTTLKQFHRSASITQLKRTFSMSLSQAFAYLWIPNDLQGRFENKYLQNEARLDLKPALFPGIATMFQGLEKNLLPGLGIVTSGGNQEVDDLAKNFKFMKKIWIAVTADTIPYHKPAPEPLLTAVDQMGMNVQQTLYIGDALVDMNAARNAKMDFGIAGWGADPKIHFTDYQYNFKQPIDVLKLL